jgi:hypothetical protein
VSVKVSLHVRHPSAPLLLAQLYEKGPNQVTRLARGTHSGCAPQTTASIQIGQQRNNFHPMSRAKAEK